jgi:hypothetical protein
MSTTQSVLKLLNSGSIELPFEGITHDKIYEVARERSLLPQLFAIYKPLAPQETKLKDYYHGLNLKSALNQEFSEKNSDDGELCRNFIDYRINWGRKYLLIGKLTDEDIKSLNKLENTSDYNKLIIDETNMFDDRSDEVEEQPLTIMAMQTFENQFIQMLIHETVISFSYEQPNPALLSEAGKQLINQIRLKKKVATNGFHKLFICKKNKILVALIDGNSLKKYETPAEKLSGIIEIFKTHFNIKSFFQNSNFIGFFSTISKLYKDNEAGQVQWGYFYTSAGATVTNKVGGDMDLREDPFQKGGAEADTLNLTFTKLDLLWPDLDGFPEIKIHGSSDMHAKPKESLPWVEVLFSTNKNHNDVFLKKLLDYAYE